MCLQAAGKWVRVQDSRDTGQAAAGRRAGVQLPVSSVDEPLFPRYRSHVWHGAPSPLWCSSSPTLGTSVRWMTCRQVRGVRVGMQVR